MLRKNGRTTHFPYSPFLQQHNAFKSPRFHLAVPERASSKSYYEDNHPGGYVMVRLIPGSRLKTNLILRWLQAIRIPGNNFQSANVVLVVFIVIRAF